jgi:NADH-quinone oxidoreductase subunit M
MVIAAIGTVLAAGYLLWMLQRVTFGVPKPEFAEVHIHDLHVPEWISWTPLLIFIVVLGVYPHLIFRVTDGAITTALSAAGLR